MKPRVRQARPAIPRFVMIAVAAGFAACGARPEEPVVRDPAPRTVQPGAPGEASRVVEPGAGTAPPGAGHVEADARFMRDMIIHHAQALVMTDAVDERAGSDAVRLMARRIEISQASEIAQMRRWLQARGEAVPPLDVSVHTGAGGAHEHMPGMATPEDLARLAAAWGGVFDRLFLELMIRHHEGALVMVADLLATEGAGQEPELFQFLSHVDADQRAEIARMQTVLSQLENDQFGARSTSMRSR